MRQRIFPRALALLLCLALTMGTALAVVDPPANTYVGDYAGVLSDSTEQHIIEQNDILSAATGGAIVVITVDFLDGLTIDDYAYQIFNDWGIGSASEKNGLLLLLAIGEDDYYALQGTGLESALPSSKLADYLDDYLEDDFAAGDYDAGVRKVFDTFYGWYESYYGSLSAGTADGQRYPQSNPGGSYYEPAPQAPVRRGGGLLIGVVVLLIVLVIVVVIAADSSRYRRYRRRYLLPGMPPPPRPYRPFLFGRPPRPPYPPRPPRTPPPPPPPRPPMGGGTRPPTGGGFNPGGFGGGASRGGGAGRSAPGPRASSAGRSSFGGASRSSGAGRSGGSRGGFGGGTSRGGGAGRRR